MMAGSAMANCSSSSCLLPAAPDPHLEKGLLPALLQIFLTVGLGWAAGSLGVFSPKEARGLGMFVGKISLPALILTNLASLDLSNIQWSFLLAVLVSKTIIFVMVLLLDFLLARDMSRAAIFAIYSTQTNDFGMGLPILTAVYGPHHDITRLIYLVAPISLLILNPIGFVLLEIGRGKDREAGSGLSPWLAVPRGLITNPVLAMTVLGVVTNLAFSSAPPPHLDQFFSTLGAAFSALAPFSLGISMAGKLRCIRGDSIKPILALVTVKSIVTPTVTYLTVVQVAAWLDGGPDPALANFALLLGSFPSALGVASYAAEYRVYTDLVSTGIVLGTLASAPLMYGIANTLTALSESPEELTRFERSQAAVHCLASIAAASTVLGLFLGRGVWRRGLHILTTGLLLLTLLSSTAGLLHTYYPARPGLALTHLTALHASRLAAPALALSLLQRARGSTALASPAATLALLLAGPLLALPTLLLTQRAPYSPARSPPFGPAQETLGLAVDAASLLPTLLCLTLYSRPQPRPAPPGAQLFRHSLLLLTLAAAAFTSIALSLGRILLAGSFSGAFKVVISLNSLLSYGQGLLFLAVFGLDQLGGLVAPVRRAYSCLEASLGRRAAGDSFVMVSSTPAGGATPNKQTAPKVV
jgi:predicted permease